MDSFKTLQDEISQALVSTTRSASRIASADVSFQRSLNPAVGGQLDAQNARLLHLAQRLLENAAASSDAVGPKLPDVESVDANWRGIVDVIDSLLEKADTSLDEYTGVVKRLGEATAGAQVAATSRPSIVEKKNIPKPQLLFEHLPTNNDVGGFRPLITSKPHAKVPLEQCLKTFQDLRGRAQYPHPYHTEIESYEYPPAVYELNVPLQYPPFESTTATFVDTPEALAAMLAELKTAQEIAIDLEHHENRSYVGIVSLMQISTRDKDWIVDTLKPWRRKLECLNEVFANPSILKVLHGAHMDIVWLQRDLGLYVVGLFDTFHAARALGYPGASLAYLLERHVQFRAQKQYQLADWRVRPLSQELFEYARADTHFLLYIYDNLRNELIQKSDFADPEKNKIQDVLQNSKETALQRFEHYIYDAETGSGSGGWHRLISKTPAAFTPQQFSVFRAVHKWRDDLSRREDEGLAYVMPNHAIFSIARTMPSNKAALYTTVQHVSPLLRAHADEFLDMVAKAKEENGPDMKTVLMEIADRQVTDRPNTNIAVREKPTPLVPKAAPEYLTSSTALPAIRAAGSDFWGGLWQQGDNRQQMNAATIDVNLALPLPPLTAEIFTQSKGASNSSTQAQQQHKFVPKHERAQEDERTDIFVVKQLGGMKRKRHEGSDDQVATSSGLDPMTNDEIMLEQDVGSDEALRAQNKAARKEAKKERKREQVRAAATNGDEPVFDYANAPSVLHAQNDNDKKKDKKDKKKKGGFNAFTGLTNAPKGLPRAQKEIAGRSRTFKS